MTRAHVTSTTTGHSAPDMDAWLRLERLDYVRLGERLAVVRLLAGLGAQLRAPTGASLVVQAGQETTTYLACGCKVERAKRPRLLGGELLWRACFAVPLDVVEFPCALFELSAPGRAALALPVPDLRLLTAQRTNGGRGNPLPAGSVRRRLVVVATTLAITGSTPGIALAATGAHHPGAGAPRRRAALALLDRSGARVAEHERGGPSGVDRTTAGGALVRRRGRGPGFGRSAGVRARLAVRVRLPVRARPPVRARSPVRARPPVRTIGRPRAGTPATTRVLGVSAGRPQSRRPATSPPRRPPPPAPAPARVTLLLITASRPQVRAVERRSVPRSRPSPPPHPQRRRSPPSPPRVSASLASAPIVLPRRRGAGFQSCWPTATVPRPS
jgi:hypothetical protein